MSFSAEKHALDLKIKKVNLLWITEFKTFRISKSFSSGILCPPFSREYLQFESHENDISKLHLTLSGPNATIVDMLKIPTCTSPYSNIQFHTTKWLQFFLVLY